MRTECEKHDRHRERHERSLQSDTADDGPRITLQMLRVRQDALTSLNKSVFLLKRLLQGDTIEATIAGMPMDRWGSQYRALRAVCLRSGLENLNYWHARAKHIIDINSMEREIQGLRDGVDQVLNGDGC